MGDSVDVLMPFCLTFAILGQFDDAGLNLALALTATEKGATIANHIEVPRPCLL